MKLLWNFDVKRPEFESLNGDIKTDVLIIGGGITGLCCNQSGKNKSTKNNCSNTFSFFKQARGIFFEDVSAPFLCNCIEKCTFINGYVC